MGNFIRSCTGILLLVVSVSANAVLVDLDPATRLLSPGSLFVPPIPDQPPPSVIGVNAGFETGDFTGWNTGSCVDCSVVTGYDWVEGPATTVHYAPTQAANMALVNGHGSDTSGFSFSHTVAGHTVNTTATDGALLTTHITVTATETLYFDWGFFTPDYLPYNDFLMFAVDNGVSIIMADVLSLEEGVFGGGPEYTGDTGWQLNYSWTPGFAFDGTIGWVVSNAEDSFGPPSLLLDNLRIGTTGGPIPVAHSPIPPALWMFGSGLAGLAAIARRRKAVNS